MNIPTIISSSIIGAIVGISVGSAVTWRLCARKKKAENPEAAQKKQNIKKLKQYIKHDPDIRQTGKITNNDVERILGVSNATAWRYLEEMEKKGKIKQVGKTGKHTYYEKI